MRHLNTLSDLELITYSEKLFQQLPLYLVEYIL